MSALSMLLLQEPRIHEFALTIRLSFPLGKEAFFMLYFMINLVYFLPFSAHNKIKLYEMDGSTK